jgi:acyl-homoserine lactone acylase PvdQ
VLGEPALDSDRQLRTFGLARVAAQELTLLRDDTRTNLNAYAEGVNKFLEQHGNSLALEFVILGYRPQRSALDSIVVATLQAYDAATNLEGQTAPLALRWTALDPGRLVDFVFGLPRAGSWQEFREAAADLSGAAVTACYADVDGHIGYQLSVQLPARKGDGQMPVPGWTNASERMIADLSDLDRSLSVTPEGESGQPGSRYWGDQTPLWSGGDYKPMRFSKDRLGPPRRNAGFSGRGSAAMPASNRGADAASPAARSGTRPRAAPNHRGYEKRSITDAR